MLQNESDALSGRPLRMLAAGRGIKIGAAVAARPLRDEPAYGETLAREFNVLTCENVMKFGPLRPQRDRFCFDDADAIVAFAREHNMSVRGHALLWHHMLPTWVTEGKFARDEWIVILREHIHAVVNYYEDDVFAWDVVNEGVAEDGSLRDTPWLRRIGPDYIDLAFHWANEAAPQARLFYNEYGADGLCEKSGAIHTLMRDLLKRGVPVHGVGLQMHLNLGRTPRPQDVAANIDRFGALGLEVHITEMDVAIEGRPSEQTLREQAQVYRDMMRVCLEAPNCTTFVMWGFTDRHSWIPHFFPRRGAALLFDDAYRPKLAYHAVADLLAKP